MYTDTYKKKKPMYTDSQKQNSQQIFKSSIVLLQPVNKLTEVTNIRTIPV